MGDDYKKQNKMNVINKLHKKFIRISPPIARSFGRLHATYGPLGNNGVDSAAQNLAVNPAVIGTKQQRFQ